MAYDEYLEERLTIVLNEKKVSFEKKKMKGGLCFMVDGKMCCGIVKNKLMARIGEEAYQVALSSNNCNEMDFTGRPMKGYVFINPDGVNMQEDLEYWVQLCIDFNPLAKAGKKKKRK